MLRLIEERFFSKKVAEVFWFSSLSCSCYTFTYELRNRLADDGDAGLSIHFCFNKKLVNEITIIIAINSSFVFYILMMHFHIIQMWICLLYMKTNIVQSH